MAITLVGEIVNSCDAVTGFSAGNISGDDDFVEGTGAIGAKVSATTTEFYTTTLGATAPYSFASGGGEFGWHIILWFNTKTPVNATSGLRIIVGNGTSRGNWYVVPAGFYKGGFITRVINSAAAFDVITAGSWTLGGNPAQLSNVTQVGGGFTTTTSIMGSFNNCQLDQITIGLGVRADAGTVGTPNTFETVRNADESTNYWGWWSSSNGAIISKGKLYIGPVSGTATSVFTDSAFTVIFANERVATGFYEIATRGTNTDVTWSLASISAASPSAARWSLTVDSTTKTFSDTNGVWKGADVLTLNSTSTLTGTSLINCTSLVLNSATMTECVILSANTADGVAFITTTSLALITYCSFTFSDGHAIVITTPGTYTFTGNIFTGYGTTGSNDAMIYNNSGGLVTINYGGGGTVPTYRNGASASTVVQATFTLTLTGLESGIHLSIVNSSTRTELKYEVLAGTSTTYSHGGGETVDLLVTALDRDPNLSSVYSLVLPTADSAVQFQLLDDPNYVNP